jgi:hypothetical protein
VKAESRLVRAATGIANLHLGLAKRTGKPSHGQVLDGFAQVIATKRVPLAPKAQQARLDKGNARIAIVDSTKLGDKRGNGIH